MWGDKWLMGTPPFRVQTPILERDLEMKVSELIDQMTG